MPLNICFRFVHVGCSLNNETLAFPLFAEAHPNANTLDYLVCSRAMSGTITLDVISTPYGIVLHLLSSENSERTCNSASTVI
jgi:hypothetical protein